MCTIYSAKVSFSHSKPAVAAIIDNIMDIAPKNFMNRFVKYANPYKAAAALIHRINEMDISEVDDNVDTLNELQMLADELGRAAFGKQPQAA